MSVASCYDLTLRCDSDGCYLRQQEAGAVHPMRQYTDTFTGEYGSACRRAARKAGWKFNETEGWAYCRRCAGEAPKKR